MADEDQSPNESFNLDKLKELIELMEKHDLTDVHLRHGAEQWRLRRGPQVVAAAPAAYAAPAPSAPAASAAAPEAAAPAAPPERSSPHRWA